jgi:3-mercaptopyruvate sulfurtransferase SseA
MLYTTPTPIQATTLREWVLSKQPNSSSSETASSSSPIPKTFKIVDVRDDDYVGGHIPGTLNVPSQQFSSRVDSLLDELKDNEAVVFTCALSQQRGPNVLVHGFRLILGCAKVFE